MIKNKNTETTIKEDIIFFCVALVVIPGCFFVIMGIIYLFTLSK